MAENIGRFCGAAVYLAGVQTTAGVCKPRIVKGQLCQRISARCPAIVGKGGLTDQWAFVQVILLRVNFAEEGTKQAIRYSMA